MKRQLLYFLLICTVPAILYFLSLEKVIPTPADETHAGLTEIAECFECHGEGEINARKKEHPPKDQCFECH